LILGCPILDTRLHNKDAQHWRQFLIFLGEFLWNHREK
jgi:hypothetical protein